MFGIGFTELLLISIVAILFLGPDKLPHALVDVAKFFKSVKKTISDAKSTFDEEIRIAELKKEALDYKAKLEETSNELQGFRNFDVNELLENEQEATKKSSVDMPQIEEKPTIENEDITITKEAK